MTKEKMPDASSPNYEAPVIKVVSFTVEQGFAGSPKIGSTRESGTEGFLYEESNTRNTSNGWSNGEYF